MPGLIRQAIHRYVPANFGDPIGLAQRLFKTQDSRALFAMASVGLEVLATPLDMTLSLWERLRYRNSAERKLPIVLVCGAPRSGTTIAVQLLVQHLPVTCFRNLTTLFPRSPLTATQICCRLMGPPVRDLDSFYGKTTRLAGLSDALCIWDRWLGSDRRTSPTYLDASTTEAMQQFFAAWVAVAQRPLIAKCNRLNASAHLVANALDQSYFICMQRDPLYLAQSLYMARMLIHGSPTIPYGICSPHVHAISDPIESICEQVRYHIELCDEQEQKLGSDRFLRLKYEEFCRNPGKYIQHVGQQFLGLDHEPQGPESIDPLEISSRCKVDESVFSRLSRRLEDMNLIDKYQQQE